MDNLILYLKIGFNHVLDFEAYDHILFLAVLVVVYSIKSWKKVITLVTLFTLGHSFTLGLSVFGYLKFSIEWVEFLIPISIIITSISNILTSKNSKYVTQNTNLIYALLFGLVHGIGFSNGFKSLVGRTADKFMPLIDFALGVELAQVVIVFSIVLLGSIANRFINKRVWIIFVSFIVLLLSLFMAYERIPF